MEKNIQFEKFFPIDDFGLLINVKTADLNLLPYLFISVKNYIGKRVYLEASPNSRVKQ